MDNCGDSNSFDIKSNLKIKEELEEVMEECGSFEIVQFDANPESIYITDHLAHTEVNVDLSTRSIDNIKLQIKTEEDGDCTAEGFSASDFEQDPFQYNNGQRRCHKRGLCLDQNMDSNMHKRIRPAKQFFKCSKRQNCYTRNGDLKKHMLIHEDETFFDTFTDSQSEAGSVVDYSDYEEVETTRTGGITSSSDSEDFDADADSNWTELDPPRLNEHFPASPGVKVFPDGDVSVKSVVSLFLTEEFFETVVQETNRYHEQNQEKYKASTRTVKWKDVEVSELKRFYAVSILMGQVRKAKMRDYWSTNPLVETPIFSKTMSRNRFEQMLAFLHFNNNEDINEDSGRLVKVKFLVDFFLHKFQSVYVPKQNLTLGEAVIPWKGKLSFRTYHPNKLVKFGILCRMLCESDSAYICNFNIHLGNAENLEDTVQSLLSPFQDLQYHVYMDKVYNSVMLAEALLDHQFKICGTIRINRGLPNSLKKVKLQPNQCAFRRKGELLVEVWKGKKNKDVRMISTIHNSELVVTNKIDRTTGEIAQKPRSLLEYNEFIKTVDQTDQYLAFSSLLRKTSKWTKRVAFFLCNCALINSFIVYKNLNPGTEMGYQHFLRDIAKEWMSDEEPQPNAGPSNVRSTMGLVRFDPPGRLSGSLRQHVVVKIVSAKTNKLVRRACRVCSVHKKRGDTGFMCRFCAVPLHRGACFDAYHTKKLY